MYIFFFVLHMLKIMFRIICDDSGKFIREHPIMVGEIRMYFIVIVES